MNLKHWRLTFFVLGIILCSGLMLPSLLPILDNETEVLLSMGILNSNNITGGYFKEGLNIVSPNETITWNILVKNNPSEAQLAKIKVKLLHNSDQLPDSSSCQPSNEKTLYEFLTLVKSNSSNIIPIEWSIVAPSLLNELHDQTILNINGQIIETDVEQSKAELILLFELWIYDSSISDYVFSWTSRDTSQCIWTYIRINK